MDVLETQKPVALSVGFMCEDGCLGLFGLLEQNNINWEDYK